MSLYKRANSPHWWVSIVVSGRRVRRSTETSSRREAEKFERQLRQQVEQDAGRTIRVGELTLDEACGKYWLEVGSQRRDQDDVQRWCRYILKYLDPRMLMSELTGRHVAGLVTDMRAAGIGQISMNRTVVTLQGIHNRCAKVWEEPVNVIGWKPHKSKERGRETWITQQQAKELLDNLPEETRAIVWFMLLTGVRQREAFELTWDRVNMDRGVITIEAKGGVVRDVELSSQAGMVLAQQPRTGRYVFDTTGYRKRFEKAKKAAGVPELRWHDLRHTCATWMGQSGAPLDVIRQQLGHSSITVTQKYRHVAQSEVRSALNRMPVLGESDNVVPLKQNKA